jgi:hypothetical protein
MEEYSFPACMLAVWFPGVFIQLDQKIIPSACMFVKSDVRDKLRM